MDEQNSFQSFRHNVLLDISLFVLDMLSPEKIKSKYIQHDDGIILEVPSAFITMIVDAQAGNLLLKQFIDANLVAVKNNPIHKQSQDPKIQNLVNATKETLEEIKNSVHQTILMDFAPLIKDISKTDRLTTLSEDSLSSIYYPIQVYEPLVPISSDDLRTLHHAYWQELHLSSHPLFDLYFLQIYHAQTAIFTETPVGQRELLSVGLATYKTIRAWKYGIFRKAINDYDDQLTGKQGSSEAEIRDDSVKLIRYLVANYFRKEWKSIVDDVTGFKVDLALTFARSGGIGLSDVVIELVTLHGIKFIAKGIKETNKPASQRIAYIIVGLFLLSFACLPTIPGSTSGTLDK